MKIAIVVHGRFEAFDLARELVRRGHQVRLLTNYPRWAVERFGVPGECVSSLWPHGVLTRVAGRLCGRPVMRRCEPQLHRLFGRWASTLIGQESWDVVYTFSGVAEESLRARGRDSGLHLVVRASAHIRAQDELLRDEELRTGTRQDRPSPWMIAREEREYALADAIRVLSSFAYQTFVEAGVSATKVKLLVSGVQTDAFRPSRTHVEARHRRMLSGAPLRVLNVGTFAFRKGVWDTAAVIQALGTQRFEYRFVGPVASEATGLAKQLRARATFVPKQRQSDLPVAYAWGDIFMLPTIEDGFPAVLAQAAAAGLPILTTPNGAGWDLVDDGHNGWVLPIRSPHSFVERLRWADAHRPELSKMAQTSQALGRVRDSADVAADFEQLCAAYVGAGGVRV
jgi:glycosyltransferase involved in cell wall biosynthesis